MSTPIILNGHTYTEAERGRFDASLIDNGEEIARTDGGRVIMFSGIIADVLLWAESLDILTVVYRP